MKRLATVEVVLLEELSRLEAENASAERINALKKIIIKLKEHQKKYGHSDHLLW